MPEPTKPRSTRDLRLDAFRGLCLAMIFINHMPGNVFEYATTRNFGFSDAAEGFVMMSGIAAGLAYSAAFRAGFVWPAVGRVWRRAWTIYLVQAVIALGAMSILSWGTMYLGAAEILKVHDFGAFLEQPFGAHFGLPFLTYQISYANILPLYIVLLMAAPVMLWAGQRWPLRTWGVSALVWVAAGISGVNFQYYPLQGGWFFNPLSWQFIFCTGLLIGIGMKEGRRLVPVRPWLQWATAAFLFGALLTCQNVEVSRAVGSTLWAIQETGVHRFFTTFEKTFETPPRLLHILALTYLLSTLPVVKRLCASRAAAPLVLLGRNALPVFTLGSLMALAGQVVKTAYPPSLAIDSALVICGLALQLAFAWALEKGRLDRPKPAGETVAAR